VSTRHFSLGTDSVPCHNLGMSATQKIEAYGVKGLKSKPWRKVFKSQAAFEKWLEANEGDVEVYASRVVEEN
jgi:hypothetical protein